MIARVHIYRDGASHAMEETLRAKYDYIVQLFKTFSEVHSHVPMASDSTYHCSLNTEKSIRSTIRLDLLVLFNDAIRSMIVFFFFLRLDIVSIAFKLIQSSWSVLPDVWPSLIKTNAELHIIPLHVASDMTVCCLSEPYIHLWSHKNGCFCRI